MNAVLDIIKKGPEKCMPIDLENIKYIIENSKDINIQDSEGATALALCSSFCNINPRTNTRIAKLLIENNANVNIQDNSGETALMRAAAYCNYRCIEFAKLLLSCVKNNADVNIQDKYYRTAIMFASLYNIDETCSLKMSQLLLEYDAKPHDTQGINILANNIAKLNVLS